LQHMHMRQQIINFAKSLGFDLVGFSPSKIESKYLEAFDEWIEKGNEGEMSYMRKIEQRRDLTQILPGAKSVIVLALNYYREQEDVKEGEGKVARYAYGRDYHKIITKKLKMLVKFLEEIAPEHKHRAYVDTGPILERALAEQAGIGVIGKNACLITPEFGSWVFISEIITTLELAFEVAPSPFKIKTHPCGNCRKCIDACPTGAIIAPGVIDSRLCISYLTIENKDKIPPELAEIIRKTKRLYGCDICQEVCPHNGAREKITTHGELTMPKIAGSELNLDEVLAIKSSEDFLQKFAGSPVMRAKREGLARNAKVVKG